MLTKRIGAWFNGLLSTLGLRYYIVIHKALVISVTTAAHEPPKECLILNQHKF